jgi:shikimate kinase
VEELLFIIIIWKSSTIIQKYFLRASVATLAERLSKQKEKRPLIANITDENLAEFIAKHLFERNDFYNKAQISIITDNRTPKIL